MGRKKRGIRLGGGQGKMIVLAEMWTVFFSLNTLAKRNRFHMRKSKESLVHSQLVMKPSFQHLLRGQVARMFFLA